MEKVGQASINFETLEASLQRNLETSRALSEGCCIYRVPQKIRCFNPNAYTPQLVSIGPYHRGKEQLKSMEGHKKTYLHHFLQRTNNKIGLKDCLQLIKSKETELRDCYSETIDLSSNDFVEMILIDAVFLIEVLLRASHLDLRTSDDHLFEKPWIASLMWPDLWLLENQLPLFIIHDLFDLVQDHYHGLDLITLTSEFASYVLQRLLIENTLIYLYFPDAAHFLDLVRQCLQPPMLCPQNILQTQNIPSVTALHRAGVKFNGDRNRSLFDITFDKGILEIPVLRITESTDYLFRNLQAFERLHYHSRYINDYVIIMNYLVNNKEDVELLVDKGVIDNWLWSNEAVSSLFQNLVKGTTLYNHDFQYSYLVKEVQDYCRSPRHRWKALLQHNYFNSPWAIISIIAAVILLLLTCIQTACSIIAIL